MYLCDIYIYIYIYMFWAAMHHTYVVSHDSVGIRVRELDAHTHIHGPAKKMYVSILVADVDVYAHIYRFCELLSEP